MIDPGVMVLRLVLASAIGGVIGLQRESVNKTAGFRTHLLVCVGSALIMLVSIYGFADVGNRQDPARLAAQVISGIGFLGAGTIMKEGLSVKGLTTAASLWVVSAIGLACGSGMFLGGLLTAIIVYVCLSLFAKVEALFVRSTQFVRLSLVAVDAPGLLGRIGSALGTRDVSIINIKLSSGDENDANMQVYLWLKLPHYASKDEVMATLQAVPGLRSVQDF